MRRSVGHTGPTAGLNLCERSAGTVSFFWRSLVREEASLHGALLGASLFAWSSSLSPAVGPHDCSTEAPGPHDLPPTADEERLRRCEKRTVRIHQAIFMCPS